jgi:hypothetical protein
MMGNSNSSSEDCPTTDHVTKISSFNYSQSVLEKEIDNDMKKPMNNNNNSIKFNTIKIPYKSNPTINKNIGKVAKIIVNDQTEKVIKLLPDILIPVAEVVKEHIINIPAEEIGETICKNTHDIMTTTVVTEIKNEDKSTISIISNCFLEDNLIIEADSEGKITKIH